MDVYEIISIYCIVSDYNKSQSLKSRKNALFCHDQLVHFSIIAAKYFGGNFSKTYDFFLMGNFHRRLPSRSKVNRRLLKIPTYYWKNLLCFISRLTKTCRVNTFLVDSFPMFACSPRRSYRSKLYSGKEWIGYSSSKKTFFYGIKVHMVTTANGLPVDFCFLPGSIADLRGLNYLLDYIETGSRIVGDKAYWSSKVITELGEKEIFLIAPKKSNAKKQHKPSLIQWIKSTRQRIETSFSQILKSLSRYMCARSREGFELRITLAIICFSVSFAN